LPATVIHCDLIAQNLLLRDRIVKKDDVSMVFGEMESFGAPCNGSML
jgi:hypothetical protein